MSESRGYTIQGRQQLTPLPASDLDRDPRGIIWMYEPPNPRATYCMGVDPSVGITSWHRALRTRDDMRTDNGAIEIIRLGRNGPDVQVCEYAAPIDPEDLADVANALGRLYAGAEENEECLAIVEIFPGPGLLTQRRLINDFGYTNLFVWKYLDSMAMTPTKSLGWTATTKSVRDLWIRGSRHINRGAVRIHSEPLIEEMVNAEQDPVKMTAKAIYGHHDDRLRAFLLAIWALHDWSGQIEIPEHSRVEVGAPAASWQASDISAEQMYEAWDEKWSELSEEPY